MVEPRISVTCKATAGWLQIEYSVSNATDRVVLSYDGAPGKAGPGQLPDMARQVYVHYEPPSGVVVKRIRPPLPEGEDITFAFVPAVFMLEPGQSRTVAFRLPLPLAEFSQYAAPTPIVPVRQVQVEYVRLVIGYFFKENGTTLKPLAVPGVYKPGGQYGPQRYLEGACSAVVPLDVRMEAGFPRV